MIDKEEMYENITLGSFSVKNGGTIYLPPGINMEYDSGDSSYIHEMYHEKLTISTNIGLLIHIVNLELIMSDDEQYQQWLQEASDILYEVTREIQEIYANSMEMLWLKENYGDYRHIYEKKTDEYKAYLDKAKAVWNDDDLSIQRRREIIDEKALSVLNYNIMNDGLVRAFRQKDCGRFKSFLVKIINERMDMVFSKGEILNDALLDEFMLKKFVMDNTINLRNDFEASFSKAKQEIKKGINLNNIIQETLCTFDISKLKIRECTEHEEVSSCSVLVHNAYLSNRGIADILIQHVPREQEYQYFIVEDMKAYQKEQNKRYLMILDKDFEIRKNKPYFFSRDSETVLIVLFSDYREYEKWIIAIAESEEVYIGNLSPNSFFTILFARKRSDDKTIYVFPTINVLAERIKEKLKEDTEMRYPNVGTGFYSIFSAFKEWVNILITIRDIVTFVTNAKGNIILKENKASQLINMVKKDVADNVMRIECKNAFEIRAALPTLKSKPDPFWIIAEFKDNECTGNICSWSGKDSMSIDRKGILFFDDLKKAKNYLQDLKDNNTEKKHYIVGLDNVAYEMLRKYLKSIGGGMLYYIGKMDGNNSDCIKYMELEEFEYYKNR